MKFLLDTNVVSEWVKPRPDSNVVAWLDGADEDSTFLSVATLAELRDGVERLAPGRRRERLDEWLREELPLRFEGRILPIADGIAHTWGMIVAHREAAGRPIGIMDAFIAATAQLHGLTIVTGNVADFEGTAAAILNPWVDS